MRIVLLNDDHPVRTPNSVSVYVGALAEAYKKAGHEVTLITAHDANEDPNVRRADGDISLPVKTSPRSRNWHVVFSERPYRLLLKELKALKPDAVHAHNVHAKLGYLSLDAAGKQAKRVVVTLHDVMSVSEGRINTTRFLDSGGQDAHLSLSDHLAMTGARWNPVKNLMTRAVLYRSTHEITAVSKALARGLKQNGLTDVRVVHNGIDLAAWDAIQADGRLLRTAHDIGSDKRVILFGGRISEDKGAFPLLRAMRTLAKTAPQAQLLVIGDPARWDDLVRQEGGERLTNATCIGWQDKTGLKAAYAAADIVTTPSLCLDAFNLMNLEAMASRKPVVGTIFGGTPEVVEDDVTGFVRDPRMPAYASALERLVLDPALATRMGEAGRKRAEERFQLQQKANEYLQLFES